MFHCFLLTRLLYLPVPRVPLYYYYYYYYYTTPSTFKLLVTIVRYGMYWTLYPKYSKITVMRH